ncbi:putative protein EIN4-like [Capsicum annuum]|nr:putative protein EIN4-like [Capsicum annuum]
MNRFSLGISQLDNSKQYKEVVNFAPDSFDYESYDFNENRSNHRNDPHTMKKLLKKKVKTDKKKEALVSKKRGSNSVGVDVPAKRRRVVKVISRDELQKDPFRVKYITGIAQQDSESLDCGVFVAVYAEYLSKELGILSSGIDAQYHRMRYATFLCKYGSIKAEKGYFSENDDPPRQRSSFTPKEKVCALHIE